MNNRAIRAYRTLNDYLADKTFLVGERITLADLVVAGVLSRVFLVNFDAELRKELFHVVRYAETVINDPKIKGVFGPLEFADKPLAFVPPPKEKKEPAPKVEKAAKAPKPKTAEEEDEDEDEKPIEEPKPKNPLDLLPKSSFNLEEWKRVYSNNETRGAGGSLEWFYNKSVSL